MNINVVTISGRMTKQGELRHAGSKNIAIMNGTIAVNGYKKEDEANFFDFVLFGKTAENIYKMTDKGCRIAVNGSLKQERWTDKSGQKRSTIKIIGNNVEIIDFAESKKADPGLGHDDTFPDFTDDIFEPTDGGEIPWE